MKKCGILMLILGSALLNPTTSHSYNDVQLERFCHEVSYEMPGYGIWIECHASTDSCHEVQNTKAITNLETYRKDIGKAFFTFREMQAKLAELIGKEESLCDRFPESNEFFR